MPVRVDKWLWAVRIFKTRSRAASACSSGRVAVNDQPAKPATRVGPGDVVTVRRRDRTVVCVVIEPISRRVSAALAADCLEDRSPPVERSTAPAPDMFARRDAGAGRPTKRDRRQIDRLRRRR